MFNKIRGFNKMHEFNKTRGFKIYRGEIQAMNQSNNLRFLLISLLVFFADWASKTLANHYLDLYIPLSVFPSFNLTLAYNTGAAFSFLDNASAWTNLMFGCIALGVSIGILVWLCRLPRQEKWMSIGLALILGGALGNLWDRIRYQHVIDFLDFYVANWHWPVFNLADLAVSMGAILVAWKWLNLKK